MNEVNTRVQFKQTLEQRVEEVIEETVKSAVSQYAHLMQKNVRQRIDELLEQIITNAMTNVEFPQASIKWDSIDFTGFTSERLEDRDNLRVKGIESFSNDVQLTVLDDTVVIENDIVAKRVKADVICAKGLELDPNMWQTMKEDFRRDVIDNMPAPAVPKDWSFKIAEMDAKIEVNSKRAGQIKELEVTGEALLSDVLYTTPGNKRVGINTMEPSDALTVWDQEAEVVIGKHKTQEGYIGTRRRQDINIGANNKVGITVRSDGSVVIDKLVLLNRVISSSDEVPGHAAKRGDIVLNDKVESGNPIGWVCLDGIRWSGFGLIQ